MPALYSPKGSQIKPYKLTGKQLTGIGRMVRACAEIDDIINLQIYKLSNVTEGVGIVLLGRTPTSARLKLLHTLSRAHSPEESELYKAAFDNDHYRDLVKCRNTVAHGQLLGLTDDGEIAFQVADNQGVEGGKIRMTVNAYGKCDFENLARMAEGIIPQLEAAFALRTLREKRRSPTLVPHMKAQGRGKRKAALGSLPK
jgi:hypothetical protein